MSPEHNAPQSASVLMPTWQGMEFLDRVLDSLAAQATPIPWDLVVVDSDSTDGTVERILERSPELPFAVRVVRIRSREFDHGDTRNLLASRSEGDLLVYLTQDAIPSSSDWLWTLIQNFDDPTVGAVSCGNVPREDASLSARIFSRDDPGYARESIRTVLPTGAAAEALTPDERRSLYDFQNVASAVRRSLWERFPFPRTMMGEDVLMARGVLEAGYATAYDSVATVDHSHDYGVEKLRWRGQVDARFNAEWLGRTCVLEDGDREVLVDRMIERDLLVLAEIEPDLAGDGGVEEELRKLRSSLVQGLYEGGLSTKRYARSAMLETGRLRVLLITETILAGGPPAGQYAFRLARELLDLGHEVRVAHFAAHLGGSEQLPGQVLGVPAVACGGVRACDELIASFGADVVHAVASTRAPIRALRRAIVSNRPTLLTILSEDALPRSGTNLHDLVSAVDRVIVPTQRMVGALDDGALEDGALDQHRLELSAPGLFASLPQRLRRVRTGAESTNIVIVADLDGRHAAIVSQVGARHRVQRLEGSELPGPDAAGRLEICAGAACIVVLGAADSTEALWTAREAREAGIPCVVLEDSTAAELQWHDPHVHAVPPDATAVCDAVEKRMAERAAEGDGRTFERSCDVLLKSIAEDARDMEYRYRTLASIDRNDVSARQRLLAVSGESLQPLGESLEQGGGRRVIMPSAEASFPLENVSGPAVITVTQTALAGEQIRLGGGLWIDSHRVAQLPLQAPVDEEVRTEESIRLVIPRGAARLRIVAEGAGPGRESDGLVHARIDTVVIERTGISALGEPDRTQQPSSTALPRSLLERCRSLKVPYTEPMAADELPTLALIIPTLDGKELLSDCLRSLQDVDYPRQKLTLCVVDNGSSDGTTDWLANLHPAVKVVALDCNFGFAEACNLGVEATGAEEVVAFVNNDMRFDRRFLIELVTPIGKRACDATTARRMSWDGKTLDGAGVGSTFVGIAVQPGFMQPLGPEHEIRRKTLFPCGAAMAMSRAAFEDLGGFDTGFFAYYEDLDLGWRAWVAGYDVHYVPTAVCEHHHSHTSSRFAPETVRRMVIRNSLLACFKNYDEENFAKILPASMALAIERAFLKSNLDVTRFDPVGQQDVDPGGRRLAAPGEQLEAGTVEMSSIGAADLVALHDVLGRWDEVLKRRMQVQAMRRRDDAEIFPMFLEPLACVEEDSSYQHLQRGLIRWLGIEDLFRDAAYVP